MRRARGISPSYRNDKIGCFKEEIEGPDAVPKLETLDDIFETVGRFSSLQGSRKPDEIEGNFLWHPGCFGRCR